MDSSYVPQSPDLTPDLSGTGFRPESPDLGSLGSPGFGNFPPAHQHHRFPSGNGFGGYQPTTVHQQALYNQHVAMPPHPARTGYDDDYMPDATPNGKRRSRVKQEPTSAANGIAMGLVEPPSMIKMEPSDPSLGCRLNTSFPVARIKRIMQADEDIGKVAQVTPTVVSRALELFMIKLISAAANQAKGVGQPGGASTLKGPKRVLAQHLKKAILADENFDFLHEIVNKVPDAPTKGKKEAAGSDSEDAKPKKKGKKRKDSGDDF